MEQLSPSFPTPMSARMRRLIGCALVAGGAGFAAAAALLWPVADSGESLVAIGGGAVRVSRELDLLMLAMVFGGLGSLLHAARSFAGFAGNRTLVASWAWWYALQPLTGVTLALLFYALVRGGLFSPGAGAGAVSPHGVAALSGLAGMFSKQAADKLSEVFSTLFETGADHARQDKMTSQPVE
ncbi:MAG: hypothetical protein ABSH45_17980 [Bryobacteraceae bacterium]